MRRLLWLIQSHIRYKIIVPYLALTLLVTMVGATIVLVLVAASAQDVLTNNLANSARATSDALVRREQSHIDFLRQVALSAASVANNTPAVADALAGGNSDVVSKTLVIFYFSGITNINLDFDRMIAFDRDGKSLIDWQRVSDDPTAQPFRNTSTDLSPIPDVKRISSNTLADGNDKFSGLIQFGEDLQPYFYTIAPVAQNNDIVGGLMIATKVDRLLLDLERSTQAPITTFYNLQGEAIGTTFVPRAELALLNMQPEALAMFRENSAQSIINSENKPGQNFFPNTIRKRAYEVAYSPLIIQGKRAGYFSVGLPTDFQVTSVSANRNVIAGIALALALGSILLGYRIARSITQPLAALVDTAEAVTAGDLERRTIIQSSDEFGSLARAFNQMTEHLLLLYRISRELGTSIEVLPVLDVTAHTVESFAPDTEVLALIDDRGTWRYRVRAGASPGVAALENIRFAPSDPLLRDLGQGHQPRLLAPATEPRLQLLGLADVAGFKSLLLTPLVVQEMVAGVLIFGNAAPDAFSGAIEPTLMATANMSASVLYNAVLFDRVHGEASEREAILKSIADGVIVCDTQRNIQLVNRTAEVMLDLHDWHIVRRNFNDVPLKRVAAGKDMFGNDVADLEHYKFGEHVMRISSAQVIGENDQVLGEVIVLHDVSSRIREIHEAIDRELHKAQLAQQITDIADFTTPVPPDAIFYFISPELSIALTDLDMLAQIVRGYLAATSPVTQHNALLQALEQLDVAEEHKRLVIGPAEALLQNVVSRWRSLFTAVNWTMTAITAEGPARNPYVFGNPVEGELFLGRGDVMRRLEELWGPSDQCSSVILYGHRRMGKSSVLRNLGHRFGPRTVVVDFNMQRIGRVRNTGELLHNLAVKMHDAWSEREPNSVSEPDELHFLENNSYLAFDRFLSRLARVIKDYRFIITIDEFELIEEQIAEGCIDPYLLEHWRSTFQTYAWLVMAFAGLHSLEEMRQDYWSPLFGSVTAIEVSFLAHEPARRLITQPAPDFAIDYDADGVEEIISLTNGQPYLIQLVGHSLVTRYNRQTFEEEVRPERRFTLKDVEIIINAPEFYRDGNAYFNGVWVQAANTQPEGQTAILRALSRGPLSLTEIATLTGLERDLVRAALYTLQHHDVISQHDGRHFYSVELMRRWVEHYQIETTVAIDHDGIQLEFPENSSSKPSTVKS
jgi:HAMP domain-containing protein